MSTEENVGGNGLPTCHVCLNLLPLLDRINRQLLYLQSLKPTNSDEEGLRCDLDKVFDSLYSAINQRETEIITLIEERSERLQSESDLAGLVDHLENAKSYSEKALVNTTKPELLALTGMIHDRAEELLDESNLEAMNQTSDITFEDYGFQDLLLEVENFGKIFNEKDVNAAVMDKTFPQEHCVVDTNPAAFTNGEISVSHTAEPLHRMLETDQSVNKDDTVEDLESNPLSLNGEHFESDSNSDSPEDKSTDTPAKSDEVIPVLQDDDSQCFSSTNQDNTCNGDPELDPSNFNSQVSGDGIDITEENTDSDAGYSEPELAESFHSRLHDMDKEDDIELSDGRNSSEDSRQSLEDNRYSFENEEESQEKECFQDGSYENGEVGIADRNQSSDEDVIIPEKVSEQQSRYPFSNIPSQDSQNNPYDEDTSQQQTSDPFNTSANRNDPNNDDDIIVPQNASQQRSSNPFSTMSAASSADDSGGDIIHQEEDKIGPQSDAQVVARNPYNGQFVYDYSPEDTPPDDGYEKSNGDHSEDDIQPETDTQQQMGRLAHDTSSQEDAGSDPDNGDGKQTPIPISPREILENFHNSQASVDSIMDSSCADDYSEPLSPTSVHSLHSNFAQNDSAQRIDGTEDPGGKSNPDDDHNLSNDFLPNSSKEDDQSLNDNNPSCPDLGEDGEGQEGGQKTLLDLLGQEPSAASALKCFINSNYNDVPGDDTPATKDTMIFGLEPDPDSDQDAILSISPKMYSMEYIIKCVHMEFDKATAFEDNHVTRDGKLVNEPPIIPQPSTSWRFKNYKGALSTRPLDSTGMSYLEFWTNIGIKQVHDGRSLIFEAAVADRDVIDLHHKAENQIHAWGVSLSHCLEHNGLCRRTWAAGEELDHYPDTLPNKPEATARLRFGFLLLQKQRKLVVIDCDEEKVLMIAENINITRPLWPVFGVYNTELSYVETTLVSSRSLNIDQNIAWLILQNI